MAKIIGKDLPNIPWQEKPQDYPRPVWRYTENPIIDRYAIPTSNSIFNSAVVPFKDGFAGVFRCDSFGVSMDIYAGFSKDAIHWEINHEPITFTGEDQEILQRQYRYDPRVCFIEDRYYITWCNGYHGPTIGVTIQSKWCAFPKKDQRKVCDAVPSKRYRTYTVWRYFLQPEPGS